MNVTGGQQIIPSANDDRDEYRSVFRRQVFELLRRGYERLDSAEYEHAHEEYITGKLGAEIQSIIEDRSSPSWIWHFAVHIEVPVSSAGRRGKNRLRLDIEFERTGKGKHPRYPFEAKRLSSGTHASIGAYMGSDGLGQFISGNYAKAQTEAGMLAYVQSETPGHWASKVDRRFKKNVDLINLHTDGEWASVSIIPSLDHCYRSKHTRPSVGNPITVFHVFLSFC